jgi:hypothetical protein
MHQEFGWAQVLAKVLLQKFRQQLAIDITILELRRKPSTRPQRSQTRCKTAEPLVRDTHRDYLVLSIVQRRREFLQKLLNEYGY